MTIPSRFREEIGEVAVLTRAFDRSLTVMPKPIFDALADRLTELSVTDPEARLLQRLIFANAGPMEFDKTGRILIPQYLREQAQLHSQAIVVGQGKYFEIWAPELWAEQVDQHNSPATAQRFKELNLPLR